MIIFITTTVSIVTAGVVTSIGVPCAIVLRNNQTAARSFCAPSTRVAVTCTISIQGVNNSIVDVSSTCAENDRSPNYYQQAIYWAAGCNSNGHRVSYSRYRDVVLTGGVHKLADPLPCWYPLGNFTGIHVPGGIHLLGSTGPLATIIMPGANAIWIEQLILVSEERVGAPNMTTEQQLAPFNEASIRHLSLRGTPKGPTSQQVYCCFLFLQLPN